MKEIFRFKCKLSSRGKVTSHEFKKITGILIISFFASFIIRILGTLFPAILQNQYIAKTAIISYSFFAFMQLLFFGYFSSYVKYRQAFLKAAGLLAIIGSSAIFLLYIKKVDLVFDINIIPHFMLNGYVDALIPLMSSLLLLLFFSTYKFALTNDEHIQLNRPILSAIIGVSIFLVLHLAVVINLKGCQTFDQSRQIPPIVSVFTLLFVVLAASLILKFYVNFYSFLSMMDKNGKE